MCVSENGKRVAEAHMRAVYPISDWKENEIKHQKNG